MMDKTEEISFSPFMFDNDSRKERTEMSMSFYLQGERYNLSVELDNKRIYSEKLEFYPSTQPAELYSRKYNKESDISDMKFGNKLGDGDKSALWYVFGQIHLVLDFKWFYLWEK